MRGLLLALFCLCFSGHLFAVKKMKLDENDYYNPSERSKFSLKTLYHSLDPLSISQHLAFYELYPETLEGKESLKKAWNLISGGEIPSEIVTTTLPTFDIQPLISLITRQPTDPVVKLTEEQLNLIDIIAARLSNRKLKGQSIWTKEEVLKLTPEEIDLSRGLLIYQFDTMDNPMDEIRQYEASIDLMALQILARLSRNATHEEKVREINRFIFHEMQFRFPPHSLHAKDIDLYTFLPSVLDNRQGVCLGVSILYLSLAQRLDLPLEIITPPGHIYVRYNDGEKITNIETTARGIDLPSDVYLGINTRKLQLRNMKEVIGMAFFNQASVFFGRQDYKTTVALYEKAQAFLPDDPLLKMFLGFNYIFIDKKSEGAKLLREIRHLTFDEAISPETIPDDYLSGKVDADGIKAVFLSVDETRESVIQKQKDLEKMLKRYPHFRAGILQLATTWLQIGRGTEAKDVLEKYHKFDPTNATIEYYLSVLSMERLDYNRAWDYLNNAEAITRTRDHNPKVLTSLRDHLRRLCPEPAKKTLN